MMISVFCDESGKFKDHPVISFAAIAGVPGDFTGLNDEWRRHLRLNGMTEFSMKQALRHALPLSPKRKAMGITNRIDALLPFVRCVRKHLQNIIAVAIDAKAYSVAPSILHQVWTQDPHYLLFARVVMKILKPLDKGDTLNIICDDEEEKAWSMYSLYRRIKLLYPDARKRLVSLSFADDEVFSPLQAADLVCSLARQQARKYLYNEDYEYSALWDALGSPLESDRLWSFEGAYIGAKEINKQAEDEQRIKKTRERRLLSK
jgi:hypothetical protein